MLIFLPSSFSFVIAGRCSCKYSVFFHFVSPARQAWQRSRPLEAIYATRSEALDVLGIIYRTETFWDWVLRNINASRLSVTAVFLLVHH